MGDVSIVSLATYPANVPPYGSLDRRWPSTFRARHNKSRKDTDISFMRQSYSYNQYTSFRTWSTPVADSDQSVMGMQPMPMPPYDNSREYQFRDGRNNRLTTTPLEQLTVVPLHAEPVPTPMTLMGLQVKPNRTSRSLKLMPSKPRRALPVSELA